MTVQLKFFTTFVITIVMLGSMQTTSAVALALLLAGCATPPREPPAPQGMLAGSPNTGIYTSAWTGNESLLGAMHLRLTSGTAVALNSTEPLFDVMSLDVGARRATVERIPHGFESALFIDQVQNGTTTSKVSYLNGMLAVSFDEERIYVRPEPDDARVDVWPSPSPKTITLPNGTELAATGLSTNLYPDETMVVDYGSESKRTSVRLTYFAPWPKANLTAGGEAP